jgi:anthranilate synthase/aminodeoxychorismate synthase-like glutamine amidotransferase
MILLIDNYDSFTYNLVQYFQMLQAPIEVVLNDKISLAEIHQLKPQAIVISPGPKAPAQAGVSVDVIQQFHQTTPILGICLGHQALSYAFGGKVVSASKIMHGKSSSVYHHGRGLFTEIPNPLSVTRYHSLMVDVESLPACFSIDARTMDDDTIMAISHDRYPLFGLQFHPESFLTEHGLQFLKNFMQLARQYNIKEKHDHQYI